MKNTFLFLALILLNACSVPNIVEVPISRSQIYYGQTMEELYDNFGAPKKAARYSNDVLEYTFSTSSIEKDEWERKVRFCDLKVFAQNNRVLDWSYEGNNCHVKEADVTKYLDNQMRERDAHITLEDF